MCLFCVCAKHIHAHMHLIYRPFIWQKYYTCINNSKIFNFLTSSDLEVPTVCNLFFCIANDVEKKILIPVCPICPYHFIFHGWL